MSAHPSRWPRDAAARVADATTQFLPTMPLELDPPVTPAKRAASVREIWHDTHAQPDADEEDTQPGYLDALPPSLAPAPAARPAPPQQADPADPLAGAFHETLGGLAVRELDNDELFQRLFGPGR